MNQNPRVTVSPQIYKPAILHRPHPDSNIGQNFHWVPYPLGLLPYDSWYNLHHRENVQPYLPFRCPVCRQARKATAHSRKVFLVAERLTWEEGLVSVYEKDLNEELNWKFNFELGILDPSVEEPYVIGGRKSRTNQFHPYENEHEMKLALKLIFTAENITETSWALWIGTQLDLETLFEKKDKAGVATVSSGSAPRGGSLSSPSQRRDSTQFKPPEAELIDLTGSPERESAIVNKPLGLPTPSSSSAQSFGDRRGVKLVNSESWASTTHVPGHPPPNAPASSSNRGRIVSYQTLQDFYSLLDRIERTSYVGSLYLEAYAEKLRDDMCQGCWFKHNVRLDMF